MRLAWVMAAAVALGGTGAKAASLEDFQVRSTSQLAALCGVVPADTYYVEAIQLCYGYLSGAAQFHNAVVGKGGLKPLACPTNEPSRSEFATYFANWAKNATPRCWRSPPSRASHGRLPSVGPAPASHAPRDHPRRNKPMRRLTLALALIGLILPVLACTENTGKGAAVGAAGRAAVGVLTGGGVVSGAAKGAAAGAAGGFIYDKLLK